MGFHWSKSAWLIALVPIAALVALRIISSFPWGIRNLFRLLFPGGRTAGGISFSRPPQTRLEVVLHRPLWALWVASFIFGLAHVPIDLQGSFANWPDALLTAFTFQMSAGIAFGYAYMHTKNLLPISIIHTVLDSWRCEVVGCNINLGEGFRIYPSFLFSVINGRKKDI